MNKRPLSSHLGGVLLILALAALALSACDLPAPEVAAVGGGLQVWLDQPPDGANLPLAPFTLKAHASDVGGSGVSQINLLVNTIPIGAIATDETLPLVYAEVEWNPAAPGLYEIQAQAFNAEGWEYSETAHVCVGGDCALPLVAEVPTEEATEEVTPTETFTPIPGVTPSATPTSPPTSTPTRVPTATFTPTITSTPLCSMAVPALTSPPNGGTVDTPAPSLTWNYISRTCPVEGFRIDLATDPSFADTSLSGGTGNPSTSWGPGQPLADCTTYYWRVAGVIGTTLGPFSETWSFTTAFPGGCGAPLDTDPPNLRVANAPGPNNPTYYGSFCGGQYPSEITFTADARDPSGIAGVTVFWRYRNQDGVTFSEWLSLPMTQMATNTWSVTFDHNDYPQSYGTLGGTNGIVEYQIVATDNANNQAQYNGTVPIYVCLG
jgi:hypothetical protein